MPPTYPKPNKLAAKTAATKLWRQYGLRTPADLDLEVLAMARGVVVVEGPLGSSDAWLVRKGNTGLIRVNQDIPQPGRKRFAVAHELGHFELHVLLTQISSCTSEDMVADYKGSSPEVEANWFAAELLMPEKLFLKILNYAFPSFETVRVLANTFSTSITATALRLVELSDEPCGLVISENGWVKWWRGNEGFLQQARVRMDTQLSEETAAGAIAAGEPPENKPVQIDAVAWGGPAYEADWWEDVLVLEKYGQTMSLIRAG